MASARLVSEDVALSDGTTVLVRSVEPCDADELAAPYQLLSENSAYRRFFTVMPRLSPQQVRFSPRSTTATTRPWEP